MSNFATPTPFGSVSCFVVGICLSNYNFNPFLIHEFQCPIQKDTSDILYIGKFWEASKKIGRYPIKVSEILWYATWLCSDFTFWPHPLSPPRGWDICLQSKITFDMFHIYCTSVCKQRFCKNIDSFLSYCEILTFDLLPHLGVQGDGVKCLSTGTLISYPTWPCSEKVEFWPTDPIPRVGGERKGRGLWAKYLLS